MTDRQLYAELGNRLRTIRRARGLTQKQLGIRAGIASLDIHYIEKYGAVHLRQERLEHLAGVLGVEAWQVVDDNWKILCDVNR